MNSEYIKYCLKCGDITNLEFLPWQENIKKRTKCSINKKELKLI